MFAGILTDDAQKVLSGYCIQPACTNRGIKMSKYMPHEQPNQAEPICDSCDVYYQIVANHALACQGAKSEFNRRWALIKEEFPGIA